jgi:hypothetical protein
VRCVLLCCVCVCAPVGSQQAVTAASTSAPSASTSTTSPAAAAAPSSATPATPARPGVGVGLSTPAPASGGSAAPGSGADAGAGISGMSGRYGEPRRVGLARGAASSNTLMGLRIYVDLFPRAERPQCTYVKDRVGRVGFVLMDAYKDPDWLRMVATVRSKTKPGQCVFALPNRGGGRVCTVFSVLVRVSLRSCRCCWAPACGRSQSFNSPRTPVASAAPVLVGSGAGATVSPGELLGCVPGWSCGVLGVKCWDAALRAPFPRFFCASPDTALLVLLFRATMLPMGAVRSQRCV